MKKFVILVILFIIALALFGYFAFYQDSDSKPSEKGDRERGTTEFREPSTPSPGVSY